MGLTKKRLSRGPATSNKALTLCSRLTSVTILLSQQLRTVRNVQNVSSPSFMLLHVQKEQQGFQKADNVPLLSIDTLVLFLPFKK